MHIVTLKRIVFAFGEKKRISVNDESNLTENRDKLFVTVIVNDCNDQMLIPFLDGFRSGSSKSRTSLSGDEALTLNLSDILFLLRELVRCIDLDAIFSATLVLI